MNVTCNIFKVQYLQYIMKYAIFYIILTCCEAVMVEGLFTYLKKTKLLSKLRKCIFSTKKKIEIKKFQITKVDQIIMFYNAMWSIIAYSSIWEPFGGWFHHFYWQVFNGQKKVEYDNGQL